MTAKESIHLILKSLEHVSGYAMEEETLRALHNLSLAIPDKIRQPELKKLLNHALSEGWVEFEADTFGDKKWRITAAGKELLESQGL